MQVAARYGQYKDLESRIRERCMVTPDTREDVAAGQNRGILSCSVRNHLIVMLSA